ncbi:hypothetical protein CAPTEDRAFT_201249 [Capitella teleta]|uniref:Reverse transcriptase domain-containing protein n=1 Tax=Capitella teleta TaxID=283909 RepID=R7UVJ5_CAPTE|nr:hypothetical protein CAPTEDRAFT_201249 [Capitella teleta]|eukprot:ELU10272.1 hypothetical protein CAPTEDRAFT_201249 [Capitella teleta]
MSSHTQRILLLAALVSVAVTKGPLPRMGDSLMKGPFKRYDNSWCFRGVYDYDNCPAIWHEGKGDMGFSRVHPIAHPCAHHEDVFCGTTNQLVHLIEGRPLSNFMVSFKAINLDQNGTWSHNYTKAVAIRKRIRHSRELSLLAVDCNKAFDTVIHPKLWDALSVAIESYQEAGPHGCDRSAMESLEFGLKINSIRVFKRGKETEDSPKFKFLRSTVTTERESKKSPLTMDEHHFDAQIRHRSQHAAALIDLSQTSTCIPGKIVQ